MAIWEFDQFETYELEEILSLSERLEKFGLGLDEDAKIELKAELDTREDKTHLHGYLTYRGLLGHLQIMDKEQLNSTVTVYDNENGEYYPVEDINFTKETDVLDKNHPFLSFN